MEFNLKLSEDMILRMEIQTFQIKQEQISNSNIGLIKDRNISQLLEIISKIIFSILNSWFDKGYQLPLINDEFYYTLNTVIISHEDGYMFIHATPNFENIDLFKLVSKILENAGYTTRGLINNILFRENAAGTDQEQDTVGGITSSLFGFSKE